MSLVLIESYRVSEDPLGPAPRSLDHYPTDPNRLAVARISPVDNGTICAAGLYAPSLSSYRTLNDRWPRAMSRLQWASLAVASVCAPLSYLWWPIWTGTIIGCVVAITASLAKRREEPVEEIYVARGSRARVEVRG